MLKFEIPFKDTSNNTAVFGENGNFTWMVRNYLRKEFSLHSVSFSSSLFNMPITRFFGDDKRKLISMEDVEAFCPSDTLNLKIKQDHTKSIHLWKKSLFRHYRGEFDSLGRKEGKWEWRYSNGNLFVETEFHQGSIVAPFKLYYFTGQIQDSISFKYYKGKRKIVRQTYYRNGQIKEDRNFRFATIYDKKGTIIRSWDHRKCDSLDLKNLKELTFTTVDGRNFLYKDSVETIIVKPDFSQMRDCIRQKESNCLNHDLNRTNKKAPFTVIATCLGEVKITYTIENLDTTIQRNLIFPVKEIP